jgi:hypothetical protein
MSDRTYQWWLAALNHPPRDAYLYWPQPAWEQADLFPARFIAQTARGPRGHDQD